MSPGSCRPCNLIDQAALRGLPEMACIELMPAIKQQPVEPDTLLPVYGESSKVIPVLARGAARIELTLADGRRQILGFCYSGDVVIAPCHVANVSVVSIGTGLLYLIDRKAFGRCREQRQDLDNWALAMAEEGQARMAVQAVLLGQLTARERIVAFLSNLAARIGLETDDGTSITFPMNRADIADFLGLKSETVSRNLTRLKKSGVITLPKPGTAVIRDLAALQVLLPVILERDLETGLAVSGD